MAADRVDFVDEDDAGGVLLTLLEEVAHARGAHADEHLDEVRAADREERDVGLAGDCAGEEGLAGSRGAHQEHALGNAAAELLELLRFLEELDDFLELFLGLVYPGDVLERYFFLRTGGQLRAALAERQGLVPAALHLPHDEDPEPDHQEDGGPGIQHVGPGAGRFRLGVHLDALLLEEIREPFVLGRSVRAELGGISSHAVPLPGYLIPGDDDRVDLPFLDFLKEIREGNRGGLALPSSREAPDHDPYADEDDPEQQTLEGRVQPTPPNRLAFKSITPCLGAVTRKSSATDCPTTQTIRSSWSTTSGRESRSALAILRSTRKSCNFRPRPRIPSGRKVSPGRRERTASGPRRGAAATTAVFPRAGGGAASRRAMLLKAPSPARPPHRV